MYGMGDARSTCCSGRGRDGRGWTEERNRTARGRRLSREKWFIYKYDTKGASVIRLAP